MRKTSAGFMSASLLAVMLSFHADAGPEQSKPPIVESKFTGHVDGLADTHVLSVLLVTVSGNKKERTHTHPGEELLFGVAGRGAVHVDGVRHALEPGAVVRVRRGQKKSLSNEGAEPLRVLAYLILEKGLPPIEMVDAQ